MSEEKTSWAKRVRWGVVIALLLLAVVAGVVVPYKYRQTFGPNLSTVQGDWNNFGTFVGGVLGPLLSALAFFGLITTIWLQEEQLTLARETLKTADEDKELTRKQLEAAIVTQEKTVHALEQQHRSYLGNASTVTFFETIKLHHAIVDGLKAGNLQGRQVIHTLMHDTFRGQYLGGGTVNDLAEYDKKFTTAFFHREGWRINHYFNNLFQALVYLTGQQWADQEAMIQFLKAQLSEDELLMLFYYGLSEQGFAMKYRIEGDGLLRGFNFSRLFYPGSEKVYKKSAWGHIDEADLRR
jgi:hypothetical protein